jgi:hypothetical protein
VLSPSHPRCSGRRLDDRVARRHEGLPRAGHPTIAVPERVDHDKVEVRQRASHQRGHVRTGTLAGWLAGDQLRHQPGDRTSARVLADDPAGSAPALSLILEH